MSTNRTNFSALHEGSATRMTVRRQGIGSLAGVIAAVLAAVLGPGCGSPPSLTVEIDAPEDANVQVEVVGPNDFSETIRKTTTFDGIAPGRYQARLKETRKRVLEPYVDVIIAGSVEGAPATVNADGGGRITVRYRKEPGSGRVWIPIAAEDKVLSFTGEELHGGGAPSYTLPMPAGSSPDAVAFRRGDLFVSLAGAGEILGFDVMAIAQPGEPPAPKVTIRNLARPSAIAFDSSGDLFVAETASRSVSRFAGIDEAPKRKSMILLDGTPRALAFNEAGTLFVATSDPPAVVVYSGAALAGTTPAPQGAIAGPKTGLTAPSGLAFDADGGLWVSNGEQSPAVRFDAAVVLGIEGAVDAEPAATLAPPSGATFDALAFDKDGAAWFTARREQSRELFTGIQMQTPRPALGAPRPLPVERPQTFGAAALAFNPPPVSSPIRR